MADSIVQQTPPASPEFHLRGIAGLIGTQLSEIYACDEHPARRTVTHEWQWSSPHNDNSSRTTPATSKSFVETERRRPIWMSRPVNWKGVEHTQALLAVWNALHNPEASSAPQPSSEEGGESKVVENKVDPGHARDDREVRKKLGVVEGTMRMAFPLLGYGGVGLSGKWMEHVLGREGVKPFSTKKWKEDAGI